MQGKLKHDELLTIRLVPTITSLILLLLISLLKSIAAGVVGAVTRRWLAFMLSSMPHLVDDSDMNNKLILAMAFGPWPSPPCCR
jgi:hypothetical protein